MRILSVNSERQRTNMSGNLQRRKKSQFRVLMAEGDKIKRRWACPENIEEGQDSQTLGGAREGREGKE